MMYNAFTNKRWKGPKTSKISVWLARIRAKYLARIRVKNLACKHLKSHIYNVMAHLYYPYATQSCHRLKNNSTETKATSTTGQQRLWQKQWPISCFAIWTLHQHSTTATHVKSSCVVFCNHATPGMEVTLVICSHVRLLNQQLLHKTSKVFTESQTN